MNLALFLSAMLLSWGAGYFLVIWMQRKTWIGNGYEDARLPYHYRFRATTWWIRHYYNKGYQLGLEQNEREKSDGHAPS